MMVYYSDSSLKNLVLKPPVSTGHLSAWCTSTCLGFAGLAEINGPLLTFQESAEKPDKELCRTMGLEFILLGFGSGFLNGLLGLPGPLRFGRRYMRGGTHVPLAAPELAEKPFVFAKDLGDPNCNPMAFVIWDAWHVLNHVESLSSLAASVDGNSPTAFHMC